MALPRFAGRMDRAAFAGMGTFAGVLLANLLLGEIEAGDFGIAATAALASAFIQYWLAACRTSPP